jgi:hypothetical protein
MKLSLTGYASVVALAAFALTASGAVAAEQKGQGCDLRGVHVPGCEPGANSVQPLKQATSITDRHDSNKSGRDPQHHRADPPPPPTNAQ